MSESFSKRHGFRQPLEAEISVRYDAPFELRGVVVQIAYECGFNPSKLRTLVCRVLRKRPDPNNWSEYPNIDGEVHELLDECPWYRVYDVIEAVIVEAGEAPYSYDAEKFQAELNEYFVENGIGWKLSGGHIEVRGAESFEQLVRSAEATLEQAGLATARKELHEAIQDLSRRPEPDITGAIQHAMAALECVAREVCGDPKANLGNIVKRHRDMIPCPLDECVSKAWGYASENARHIREGREPTYDEAELVVGMASSVATYLTRKHET